MDSIIQFSLQPYQIIRIWTKPEIKVKVLETCTYNLFDKISGRSLCSYLGLRQQSPLIESLINSNVNDTLVVLTLNILVGLLVV